MTDQDYENCKMIAKGLWPHVDFETARIVQISVDSREAVFRPGLDRTYYSKMYRRWQYVVSYVPELHTLGVALADELPGWARPDLAQAV